MRAIILAAGRGGRLRGIVGDRPKCLARVGEITLIERQIRTLRDAGIQKICVVAGFRAAQVARVCGPGIDILHNLRYASTNSLYSLWLARHLLGEGFVVLNCDVLFHPQLLADLLSAQYDDAILVGSRTEGQVYSDEEMKVCVRRGLVAAIDKSLDDADSDAENVGIAKFGAAGSAALVDIMNDIVAGGAVRNWLPRAFSVFSGIRPLNVVDSRGYPWIEIDFPEDYWRACSEVLPAIDTATQYRTEQEGVAHAAGGRPGRKLHHV